MRGTNYAAILHTNETKPIGKRNIYTDTLLMKLVMKENNNK